MAEYLTFQFALGIVSGLLIVSGAVINYREKRDPYRFSNRNPYGSADGQFVIIVGVVLLIVAVSWYPIARFFAGE